MSASSRERTVLELITNPVAGYPKIIGSYHCNLGKQSPPVEKVLFCHFQELQTCSESGELFILTRN